MCDINISIISENKAVDIKNENLLSVDIIKSDTNENISAAKMNTDIKSNTSWVGVSEKIDENKNQLPKLTIINNNDQQSKPSVLNTLNSSSNRQSLKQDLSELVNEKENPRMSMSKQNKPTMGVAALTKKANLEKKDSFVIQELINNKFSDTLNYYHRRSYRRRLSKMSSSEDDYSDTVFSSPPGCSPASISSVDTSASGMRNGFRFPVNMMEQKDLRFLRSTDDVNFDSTVEDVDTSSLNSSAVSNDRSVTSYSEYEPSKFLQNAIGEAMNRSSESGIVKDQLDLKRANKTTNTLESSDVSSLLSRATSLCNSFKQTIRRHSIKLRTPPQTEEQCKNYRQSVSSDNILIEGLMKELSIQNEILFQISKALNYGRTMKGFETTTEFIEAEKILLVASCTKTALSKEIKNIDDDDDNTHDNNVDLKSCGQIQISKLKFLPKDGYNTNMHRELTDHYVIVLTCGSTVLASDVKVADENGVVYIEKNFEFKKLPTDFEISICIYAMTLHNKSHHNQEKRSCPSAKSFFRSKVSRKLRKINNESVYIRHSSFFLWGKCTIRNPDLSKIESNDEDLITLKMYNVPLNSSLSETFSLSINSSVELTNKLSGFLTIGLDNEHGCIVWNVRWCVLEGATLRYWNHPSEEVSSALGSFDLRNCLDQEVTTVDRSLCARPRTLMVSVKYKDGERKYLLSADKLSDMKQWEKEINYVLRALSTWKCGSAKVS